MNEKLIVNFKAYKAATDRSTNGLLTELDRVDTPEHVDLMTAVNSVDLRLADSPQHGVIAQHVDPVEYGSHAGAIVPESIKRLGGVGTLLNHSEHPQSLEAIETAIYLCQDLGITVIACADTLEAVSSIAAFEPDYVAIEPPELIGTSTSVSSAEPELIRGAVERAEEHDVPVLCGAGVKTTSDVRHARDLGAHGVLVASGVVKADDPISATQGLLEGF